MLTICFHDAERETRANSLHSQWVLPRTKKPEDHIHWVLPHADVAIYKTPEIGLLWKDDLPTARVRGAVVVLGYVTLDQLSVASEELAKALLECWRAEGLKFLDRLEGSFSLFLYDAERETCLLATDTMNTRPIWIAQARDCFIVSSDSRQVALQLPRIPDVDKAYAWSFLHRRATVGDRCFFDGIRAMGAAKAITWKRGFIASHSQYYEPYLKPNHGRSVRDTAAELVEALRLTCQDAVRGSSSPSLLLSGGLDSRLIAGLCPENVTAVTLCDVRNREVRIAETIARKCNLHHQIIYRHPNWYPRMMEDICWENAGLYCWNESHFFPFVYPDIDFAHDVAMLGFASDTLFKGAYLDWPELWKGWEGQKGPELTEKQFVDMVLHAPKNFNAWLRPVIRPEFLRDCEEAFREVVADKYRQVRKYAVFAPDLWELFSFDSMYRNNSFANLTGIRHATSERNLFSSRRIWDLYLTVPCYRRQANHSKIVQNALHLVGKRLGWIQDSSSWLPVFIPKPVHSVALGVRQYLSRIRGLVSHATGSKNIAGNCGWTRFDRLLQVDATLRTTFESLTNDDVALPSTMFDCAAIKRLWQEHQENVADHSSQLYLLASFGLFRRQMLTGNNL